MTALLRALFSRVFRENAYIAGVSTGYAQIAVTTALHLGLVPLYLKYLDTWRFGVLMILFAFVNFAAFGIGWLSGGMQRLLGEAFAVNDEQRFADVYTVSKWLFIGYALVLAVTGGGALMLASERVFHTAGDTQNVVHHAILALCAYFVILYAFTVDRAALMARGVPAAANVAFIISQTVYAGLTIPVLLLGGDLVHLMLCHVTGAVAGLGAVRWYWRRRSIHLPWLPRPTSRHGVVLRHLLGRMGLGYLWASSLILLLQADTLLVGLWLGPEASARFVLVWRLAELTAVALWRLPDTLQPFIVQMDVRQEERELRRAFWLMLVVVGGLAGIAGLFYALAGPKLVSWWVGDAAPPERLGYALAGGAIFWLCVVRTPVTFAYAMARLRGLALLLGLEFMVKLVVIWFMIPKYAELAPLVAINVVHAGGGAVAYLLLGARCCAGGARQEACARHDGRR